MTWVISFISRNKDNAHIEGYRHRSKSFLADDFPSDRLVKKFNDFVEAGLCGEFCRFYVSINEVDETKVKKELAKFLIDEAVTPTSWKLRRIEDKTVSLALKKKNKLEKRWLFDCDVDESTALAFTKEIPSDVRYTIHKTPNGFAVVTERVFDTREILKRYPGIELKRDALLCYMWRRQGDGAGT